MKSGTDLGNLCVRSVEYKGKAYTLEEDYGVASELAKRFGFRLNNTENLTGWALNYSIDDVVNSDFFSRMFRHIEFRDRRCRYEDKRFHITGHHGESVKQYWNPAGREFMLDNKRGGISCLKALEVRFVAQWSA